MFRFREIELPADKQTILAIRRDSYVISFGDASLFGRAEDYIRKIEERLEGFPGGLVLLEQDGKTAGQIELQVKVENGARFGYANLFYLKPEYRGKGHGRHLIDYAEAFFREQGVAEYQLRVACSNRPALKFYQKHGFREMGVEEADTPFPRFRLSKSLNPSFSD